MIATIFYHIENLLNVLQKKTLADYNTNANFCYPILFFFELVNFQCDVLRSKTTQVALYSTDLLHNFMERFSIQKKRGVLKIYYHEQFLGAHYCNKFSPKKLLFLLFGDTSTSICLLY